MIDREQIAAALAANDFVAITYAKVNGEIVTRVATVRKRPESEAPKGVRETNVENFRYYEWGRANRFDASAPGDWASCKIANVKDIKPVTVEE